jgi:multiple sugar transport system permease protein
MNTRGGTSLEQTIEATAQRSRVRTAGVTRERLVRSLEKLLLYVALSVAGVVYIFPFYWVMTASVKETPELRQVPPTWWPQSFTLEHFTGILTPKFARYFLNTFIYAGGTTAIVVFTSTIIAFVLVKHPSRFGNIVFGMVVSAMMVPMATYILPLFLLLLDIQEFLGIPMVNTYWGMMLPWVGYPFGIFLMRQAMFSVPNELLDSAKIDGASTFRIYWDIALPVIRSNVAALAVFVFMFKYDDLLWPLIVALKSEMYPISVGLVEFIGEYYIEYGLFTAASVMAILPILILYLFLQRFIIQGIALTGLKG